MERILTVKEMRESDEYTIERLGVPSEVLIERAGTAVADEIKKRFPGGRVLVCVGRGNNGKDGLVTARILSAIHGFTVSVFNAEVAFYRIFDKKFDIIVDCLFGTGLNREVTGRYKTAIEKINGAGAFVVACDIPSGISGDTGKVMGVAVRADLTVAIQEYKTGHFFNDGPDYCGRTVARDIGISVWTENCAQRLNDKDVAAFFPQMKRNRHKGTGGKVAVIGGSKSYSGSIDLSASALTALKTGAGYSAAVIPELLFPIIAGKHPECLIKTLPDDGNAMVFDGEKLSELLDYGSLAFGVGVTVTEDTYKILCYLLKNYKGNLLIDADGLNALSEYGKQPLKDKACKVVLTPHVGEFSRLTGLSKEEITDDPVGCAKAFAAEYGVTVLLKSAVSVITDGSKTVVNVTGDAGMAKGGSGDVLTGLIAGLLLRDEEPFLSVSVGAYLFGKTGERAAKKLNSWTVTATDLIAALPETVNDITENA